MFEVEVGVLRVLPTPSANMYCNEIQMKKYIL